MAKKEKINETLKSKVFIKAEIAWQELELLELKAIKRNISSHIRKNKKLINDYKNDLIPFSFENGDQPIEEIEDEIAKLEEDKINFSYYIISQKAEISLYYQILNIFHLEKIDKKISKLQINSKEWIEAEINKLEGKINEILENDNEDFVWLTKLTLYGKILDTFHSKKTAPIITSELQIDSKEWIEAEISRLKAIITSRSNIEEKKRMKHHIKFYENFIK